MVNILDGLKVFKSVENGHRATLEAFRGYHDSAVSFLDDAVELVAGVARPETTLIDASRRTGSSAVNNVIDTVTPVAAAPSTETAPHDAYLNVLAFHKEAAEMIIRTQVEQPDLNQYSVPDQGQFTQQQYELAG